MTQMYVSPEGEVVEATPHDFVTRLKNLGYVRAEPDAETQAVVEEVTPEVEHVAVEADAPELVPEQVVEAQQVDPRSEDGRRRR